MYREKTEDKVLTLRGSPHVGDMEYMAINGMESRCRERQAGLAKRGGVCKGHRLAGWVRVQTARAAESRKPPSVLFFSVAFSLQQTDINNLHAFFMTRVGWRAPPLSLPPSLSISLTFAVTHPHTRTLAHKQDQTRAITHSFTRLSSRTKTLKNHRFHQFPSLMQNGISFWDDREGMKDAEVDERK